MGKTQGKHREFYLGWNVATLINRKADETVHELQEMAAQYRCHVNTKIVEDPPFYDHYI